MSKNPQNARVLRELLVTYLTASRDYMLTDRDKVWVQGEIDRYTNQIKMLTGTGKGQMKHTGMKRTIDQLGRLVIPMETRRVYEIDPGDAFEIYLDEESKTIMLQKYIPGCAFCGQANEVSNFRGKRVCESCIEEITNDVGGTM